MRLLNLKQIICMDYTTNLSRMKPGGQFFYLIIFKKQNKTIKKLTKYVFVNLLMDLVAVPIGILLSEMNISDCSRRIFIDSVIAYGKKVEQFFMVQYYQKIRSRTFLKTYP